MRQIQLVQDIDSATGAVPFLHCGSVTITGLWYQTDWLGGRHGNRRYFAAMWRFAGPGGTTLTLESEPGHESRRLARVQIPGQEPVVALDLGDHFFPPSVHSP